jgi:hypothetical protein
MDDPLYVSKRSGKNLGQEYRVHRDRIELQCWTLLHTIVIPTDQILEIEVRGPEFFFGINLDNCNFTRHVSVKRKYGLFKRLGFTPDDPDRFVENCQSVIRTDEICRQFSQ